MQEGIGHDDGVEVGGMGEGGSQTSQLLRVFRRDNFPRMRPEAFYFCVWNFRAKIR